MANRILALAAAFALIAPLACAEPLKVGVYGGYFKDSFDKHIFPDFTAETGIEVQSIPEPTGEAWLIQLMQAARANQAPADVSMMAQVARIKGERAGLWARLDRDAFTNLDGVSANFVHEYEDDGFYGVGAVSWYITLVTNTEAYPDAPTSWNALWDPANKGKIGLLALASNSFLLEIAATTHFGGTEILATQEGVTQVLDKIAEAKPNVQLWYRDEGQFQQALETGEVAMGQYYHDVTGLAAAGGKPVRSTFPAEGAILDGGSWVVSRASTQRENAQIFMDYMARPEIQAKLARKLGVAPVVRRELTDLTDAEFAAVASDATPIIPRYALYVDQADWMNQQWSEMLAR